jgi:uncharacterized protein (DUF305 family)
MDAYIRLAVNLILSALAMYLVMFAMIDNRSDFFNNSNMLYMTLMMVAPMAILMLATMGGMYRSKAANIGLYVGFAALLAVSFAFIRNQTYVGDDQFLRAMIPHHSGAILMCREAAIVDAEIKDLCEKIIASQKTEISQMKAILERL